MLAPRKAVALGVSRRGEHLGCDGGGCFCGAVLCLGVSAEYGGEINKGIGKWASGGRSLGRAGRLDRSWLSEWRGLVPGAVRIWRETWT